MKTILKFSFILCFAFMANTLMAQEKIEKPKETKHKQDEKKELKKEEQKIEQKREPKQIKIDKVQEKPIQHRNTEKSKGEAPSKISVDEEGVPAEKSKTKSSPK